MSMFKLQIVLVPPRALELQTPNVPVNSTPNNSMNWQNNSNARIRFPSFNSKQNNSMMNGNYSNASFMINNEVNRNLRNTRMKLNQMIAYRNYLFQKNCKKFLVFINLQSDLNDLADEILVKFNKIYPAYHEDLNILTIQDINGNDLDPEFHIKDVFNTSNVVKVLIDNDIDWNNFQYFGSKFGSNATHKRRKLNPRANNMSNTTMVTTNSTSLRFTTPMVHEIHRDIDSVMMDDSMDKSMDKSIDRSILPPPSKPQAPQIRISSGLDHSKVLTTAQGQLDTVSKSEIVDPDKSRQHLLPSQPPPIVLAGQSSPKGTLLGTPVMSVITPNKLTASEQKLYSTSNQLTDTVIHHSPTALVSTADLPPPLKTPRSDNDSISKTNNITNILPFEESDNIKISTKKANNDHNQSIIEDYKESTIPISKFERPSALSKAMRASLQRQQSTIANDRGSPVKNGPLSDDMADNVHLAELPTQNNLINNHIPRPVGNTSKTKSILEKIMEQQSNTNSTFNEISGKKQQKKVKEVKKRQIINHNNYTPNKNVEKATENQITQSISSFDVTKPFGTSFTVTQDKLTTQPSSLENHTEIKQKEINTTVSQNKNKPVSKYSTVPMKSNVPISDTSKTSPSHTVIIKMITEKGASENSPEPQFNKLSNKQLKGDNLVNKIHETASNVTQTKENLNHDATRQSNIAIHSSDITFSDIADKWPKSNSPLNIKISKILDIQTGNTTNELLNKKVTSSSQSFVPINRVLSTDIPNITASQSLPKPHINNDQEEDANTSIINTSFQKSDLIKMFENDNLDNLPWLSKSRHSTAQRVIGKARSKPYLTVLNKDIDNSKPDPRNILPSRTPRNAAQKASMKMSGNYSMFQESGLPINENNFNGSEEFGSYSESGGEFESSSSSGIMTDVSSDEEDIATLAKAAPNVPVTKPVLKESIVSHSLTNSEDESSAKAINNNITEAITNKGNYSNETAQPPIQLTKPVGKGTAPSNTDHLLDTDLSDLEASINMDTMGSNPVNEVATSSKVIGKIVTSSKSKQAPPTEAREVTPHLSNTTTSSQFAEGRTPETIILSDEDSEKNTSSINKKSTFKPSKSEKNHKQSKPKRFLSVRDRKTAAFMEYLNHPKVGDDLLLDIQSTDSAEDEPLSSSSDSEISIKEIKTVSTPLDLSRNGSDLYDADLASATNKSRSPSSMLHSIQPKSASNNGRNGLEAVTNTSSGVASMIQRINNSSTSDVQGPMSIAIAPSSDAISDHEIDNDIPETSSDYESSGVELDDQTF
ncbi:hypothetical protein MOUN0_K02388 [Monosporozyma unispora]